ncbi:hypothetical protein HNQ69_000541 [Bartonella callosciuri]|uniref:Uncharacterized protein n=1 Tax=Bartonella callosciuri TaxID=686223 RepID=A0A840NNH2_9HYPH|nr:hypothetical protein [Bartonella callosciuri]
MQDPIFVLEEILSWVLKRIWFGLEKNTVALEQPAKLEAGNAGAGVEDVEVVKLLAVSDSVQGTIL